MAYSPLITTSSKGFGLFNKRKNIGNPLRAREKGFSLLATLLIGLGFIGTITFFLAGRSLNMNSADIADTVRASTLISQASNIQAAFNMLQAKGLNPDIATLDSAPGTGLYDLQTTGAMPQEVDQGVLGFFGGLNGKWVYRGAHLSNPGVGLGGDSYAVVVTGLSAKICMALNSILHNLSIIPVISDQPVSAFRNAAPTDTATATVSLAANSTPKGWTEGCVASKDNVNVFFHVLRAQ